MTPKYIDLAADLKLPAAEAVTQKYGWIGRSGSGKTYGAERMAELFLQIGAQVIVMDWVGNWWSLRLGANGRDKGFEHVYIFGGEHGDLALEPTSGAMMADLVVDRGISVVFDMVMMRKADRTRFATAFAEQFFHRKKTNRGACHLFLEEAQAFLPQMVRGEDARMVGVFEDIGKVGRNFGIGVSLLTQRPQAVNKDVLNQTEVLLCFQTSGPQERKAVAGWIGEHGDDDIDDDGKTVNDLLPKLAKGDALVWSPQWLQFRKQIHISKRITYDASSTPLHGKHKRVAPKPLTPKDIEQLGESMRASVEKKKADDPALMKKLIAELEAKASKVQTPAPAKTVPTLTEADRALLAKTGKMLEEMAGFIGERTESRILKTKERIESVLLDTIAKLHVETDDIHRLAREKFEKMLESKGFKRILEKLSSHVVVEHGIATKTARDTLLGPNSFKEPVTLTSKKGGGSQRMKVTSTVSFPDGANGLNGRQIALLTALRLFREVLGVPEVTRTVAAVLSGRSPKSSGIGKDFGQLEESGYIECQDGFVRITDAGVAIAPATNETSIDLVDAFCERALDAKQGLMLRALAESKEPMTRDDVASAAGISPSSSAVTKNLGLLFQFGTITYPEKGLVQINPRMLKGQ